MQTFVTVKLFNISSTSTTTSEKVEDRYYTKEEYNKLSEAKKRKLWELRKARGAYKKAKGDTSVTKKQYDSLMRKVKALESGSKPSETEEDPSEEEDTNATNPSNRTNPALTKQKVFHVPKKGQ